MQNSKEKIISLVEDFNIGNKERAIKKFDVLLKHTKRTHDLLSIYADMLNANHNIDDAINQIVQLSFNNKNYNNVFNIGNSSQEIKMFDLAKKIKYLIGSKKKLISSQNTPGSPKRRVPDMKKTKAHIKYKKFITNQF